ncbi:MAG: hypothetical protein NVS3B25_19060 [Hymenobacter sp.]
MLSEVDFTGHIVTIPTLAELLGCTYTTALLGVQEARHNRRRWVADGTKKNGALALTLEGLRIARLLKRAESEARKGVEKAKLPRKKRKYVWQVAAVENNIDVCENK